MIFYKPLQNEIKYVEANYKLSFFLDYYKCIIYNLYNYTLKIMFGFSLYGGILSQPCYHKII